MVPPDLCMGTLGLVWFCQNKVLEEDPGSKTPGWLAGWLAGRACRPVCQLLDGNVMSRVHRVAVKHCNGSLRLLRYLSCACFRDDMLQTGPYRKAKLPQLPARLPRPAFHLWLAAQAAHGSGRSAGGSPSRPGSNAAAALGVHDLFMFV